MNKLAKNWKDRLIKSYSGLSLLANILVALSVSGLALVGVISSQVALPVVLVAGGVLSAIGVVGRVLDQGLDNVKEDYPEAVAEVLAEQDGGKG